MYGYRARIGYTAPLLFVEIYPYEFYKMAPEGVTLILSTMTLLDSTAEEREETFRLSQRAILEMARAGASIVVLGGATPSYALGADRVEEFVRSAEKETGVPITTARDAQIHALREVGAKRIAVVTPAGTSGHESLREFGFEVVGSKGAGYSLVDFGRLPTDAPARIARELIEQHPQADTIFFPAAHWPAVANIETLERETGRTVVTSAQAILWHALRRCNVDDAIDGFGRLMREH